VWVVALCVAWVGCTEGSAPQAPATVEITSPVAGALVKGLSVRVEGRAEHTREVIVGGRPVSVVAGVWSVSIPVKEGMNTVVAKACSSCDAQDEVTFSVDATGPKIAITSPARGQYFVDETKVMVRGTASDGVSGLELVKVGETIVEVGADGTFAAEVTLAPGLNRLRVTAIDKAGFENERIVGVFAAGGAVADPAALVDPAFSFVMSAEAMAVAASVIRAQLTPELVKSFVDMALRTDQVTVDKIAFAPLDVTMVPRTDPVDPGRPGFLDVTLSLRDVKLEGSFKLGGGDPYGLEVTVAQATIKARLYVEADGMGGLGLRFAQSTLDLPDRSISWKILIGDGALSNDDVRILGDLVERVVRIGFAELLSERVIERLYDPNILKREIKLLGRTVPFELKIQQVILNDSGAVVRAAVAIPTARFEELPEVPGVWAPPAGDPTTPKTDAPVMITTGRRALNHIIHGVWRAGLLNQRLEGASFAGFELPFGLTSGALALVIDGRILSEAAAGDLPAAIALRPQLPPVLRLDGVSATGSGTGLVLELGELHIDMILDATSAAPKRLVTLAAFLTLGVDVQIEGTEVKLGFTVEGEVDTVEEPLFDMDDQATEGLLDDLILLVPQLISQQLVLTGEADLTWLKLSSPSFEVHGLAQDQLTVGLEIEASP
jgi:hypothetical protein